MAHTTKSNGSGRIAGHASVICKNPKTGQTLTTTAKVFYSIYIDKGFELVNRGNVEDDGRREPTKTASVREPKSVVVGSAAAVAAALELAPGPNAETGGLKNNEVPINVDASDVSDERPSRRRDRGRTS